MTRLSIGLCAFGFLLLVLYLVRTPAKLMSAHSQSDIVVICTAPAVKKAGADEQKSRWLTKQAAQDNCRSQLERIIKAGLNTDVKRSGGKLTDKDIELKSNVAIQLSEIVDGQFLPDGSYEMKMKAPKPVI